MDKVPVLFRENLLYLSGKFKDMSEIEKINHVFEYNDLMGVETLNPLVSVVDWSQCEPMCSARRRMVFMRFSFKDVKCGDMRYGRQYYDYQEGTLVFLASGSGLWCESNGVKDQPKGWALVFHPDLIRGTSLGRHIDDYTFFSYEVNEARIFPNRREALSWSACII